MARFWIWAVRNPVLLLAALATAAGLYGVADDAIALTALLGLGVVAEVATHLGRRARAKEQRARAVEQALREATAVRERLQHRKAA
ncbi:MAG: hypothetical protein C0506_04695 [Anaerolinea sp.]|nr:hypothetical protein [Anaerolinea sp.]